MSPADLNLLWRAIASNPLIFLIGFGALTGAIWKIIDLRYQDRIANLQHRIDTLQQRLQFADDCPEKKKGAAHVAKQPVKKGLAVSSKASIPGKSASHDKNADEARVWIPNSVTYFDLIRLTEGKTSIEGDRAVQPYLGKWMEIEFVVDNIQAHHDQMAVNPAMDEKLGGWRYGASFFFETDHDKIPMLRRGDKATVVGKFTAVRLLVATFESCQLIDAPKG